MDKQQELTKGSSEPQNTLNVSPRIRTTSEESTSNDDPARSTGKRQRTISQQYMVLSGLAAASPPKFVSLEEIMQAANGMRDMALVHQIVVDEGFKLEKVEPEPNTIQKVVKDTMHKAFWSILRNELAEDPPVYAQALKLLEEIKEALFSLLLPQHTRIKQQISEVLDTQLIKQQAEKGVLDFDNYARYVISVMGKLCAPVRDERVKELSQIQDVVETFKNILEILELMRLDMANFTLQMARPNIIACSVELERKKFAEFLAIQTDGLAETRKWLLKHLKLDEVSTNGLDYETNIKNLLKSTFGRACLDLLEWKAGAPYPETFMLDEARLQDIQQRTNQLIIIGTLLLVILSNSGADLQTISSFKSTLKDQLFILLREWDGKKNLESYLSNIAEQTISIIKTTQKEHSFTELNDISENLIKQQILEVAKPDHRIKELIRNRIKSFFLEIITSSTAAPQQVPSGLSSLQKELAELAGQFLRIVTHNSTVFSIYYHDIISEAVSKSV